MCVLPANAAYKQQMQLLEGQKANLDHRDLLVIKLLAAGTSSIDSQPIDPTDVTQLRSRFNLDRDEFSVILVGKDGTEKRREQTPVELADIFTQIDAMPMRQQEMKQR